MMTACHSFSLGNIGSEVFSKALDLFATIGSGLINFFKLFLADIPTIQSTIELRLDFTRRALGVSKKSDEFIWGTIVKTLGNVVHNRSGGTPNLIP